jgi:epoxyqueuosine reductase QueG
MPDHARARLEALARSRGAVGFGVCRLADVRTDDFHLPADLLARLPGAVSIALPVAAEVLSTVEGEPNRLYEHHYRQVNFALDRLGLELVELAHALGARALAIPASQIVDWEKQQAHLSHKRIAVAAGVGWLGRNNLVVTPSHGAQVRLLTLLTDLALEPGPPLERDCADCRACVAACPAGAIGERQAEFDHLACFAKLREFQSRRLVSQYICGVCVRACGPR